MKIYQIIAFLSLIPGLFMVYGAKLLVSTLNLVEKVECKFESDLSLEEILTYKKNKALIKVKIIGFLITLPGLAIIIFLFK